MAPLLHLGRRARSGITLAAVAALALAAPACGVGGGGDDSSSDDSSEPITIGASLPLTGEFSQPGQAAKQGYEVWQEMVNSNGGLLGRQGISHDVMERQRAECGRDVLFDEADAQAARAGYFARGRLEPAGDAAQQRGLAPAVGRDDAEAVTRRDREVEI